MYQPDRHSIEKANRFIAEKAPSVNAVMKPGFHLTAPTGWINDPNGFCYFQGKYHIFCQYNPCHSRWDTMHWGHWTSTDLIRWTWEGVALAPDQPYDCMGCFSGTAAVVGDTLHLLYTCVHPDTDGVVIQEQAIATSRDGVHFVKSPLNPVLRKNDLPPDGERRDFRDPRVYPDQGGWRLLLANKNERCGRQLLYESSDLIHWTYRGVFLQELSEMPECPDFFHLDGKDVLVTCLMNQPREGYRFQYGHHDVAYVTGRTEGVSFVQESLDSVDLGQDFYAPQTVLAPDGRRIMVGWMMMWGEATPPLYLDHGWQGAYTFPREISLQDGKLCQRPVREIQGLYGRQLCLERADVKGSLQLEGVSGQHYHLKLTAGDLYEPFSMHLKEDGTEYVELRYDPQTGVLSMDRSRMGHPVYAQPGEEAHDVSYLQLVPGHTLALEILSDTCSLEVFAGHGMGAMTSLCFPKGTGTGISFHGKGELQHVSFALLETKGVIG